MKWKREGHIWSTGYMHNFEIQRVNEIGKVYILSMNGKKIAVLRKLSSAKQIAELILNG